MRIVNVLVLAVGFLVICTSSWVACRKPRPPKACTEEEVPCSSGACIGKDLVCDGIPHCQDGSDETVEACGNIRCPGYMFRCSYGACVTISSICNGKFNCADGSDEPPINSCKIPGNNNNPPTLTTKPYPTHCTPVTDTTTKRYTPYPSFTTQPSTSGTRPTPSKTTQSVTKPTSIKTTQSVTQPTTSHPITSSTGSTAGKCLLPAPTPDKIYTLNDCIQNSSDPFCQKKPGEYVDAGVVLNFQCKTQMNLAPVTDSFASYCLDGQWLPEIESCKYCGSLTKNVHANTHIPWQISVYDKLTNQAICGGVIISPYVVISAAHCFFDSELNWKREASNFYILIGQQSRNVKNNKHEQYNITDIRFSPDGFQGSYTNFAADIAIAEVSSAFQFDSEVSTVCFESNSEQYSEELEKSGLISLYNDNGGSAGHMESLRAPVTSYEKCVQAVSDTSKPLVTLDKICMLGRDIEHGNGGNGFYTYEPNQLNYRLRGILSSTFHDSKTNGQVSTLTDIAKHLVWLTSKVDEINQRRKTENIIDIRFPHENLRSFDRESLYTRVKLKPYTS